MHQGTLCDAIKGKNVITIRYDDDILERTFAPYIVYRSTKNNVLVAGYQINNPAEPFENNEWRNLTVDKLKAISITNDTFRVDVEFDPFHERYRGRVICHVSKYGQ
ncbi:hypothetical protein CO731_05047 [Aminobacter sp. MSH1]|uniref:WYL domain-containing protein n=1 Tax=Aminobacter sp. MSH1 TaxID=374606 RepID=UPI000D3ACFA7|nr:WYL domain-containing protein [Aminobacter sp. MSH1]AWC25549.1 hypothetical protein CO731_05047 [Aminobacter sp. MSH1]